MKNKSCFSLPIIYFLIIFQWSCLLLGKVKCQHVRSTISSKRALPNFQITKETQLEETFLSGADDRIEKIKSSLKLVKLIQRYVQKISAIGPLFRDLKIQGQTYITKEQIRRWYQETNQELPLYQRSQLLQTKLLKKSVVLKR